MNAKAWITAAEAAQRWAISIRRVQSYCVAGRVAGAEKWGRAWMIPADARRPADGRRAEPGRTALPASFARQSPMLTMTDLCARPGRADEAARLEDRASAALLSAHLQYLRGEIDAACEGAERVLAMNVGLYAQIGAGILLSLCAMHRGDEPLWNAARERISGAPCQSAEDEELRAFWLAASDSAIYSDDGYPEWFRLGRLSALPADSQPAARFFYVKHLYLQSVNALREKGWSDAESAQRMRLLPCVAEPLIAQTRLEGVYVAEIYLCLLCAICCHADGDDARAAEHIDRAIALALPDRLYGPLAEYEVNLDFLMDERLRAAGGGAYQAVKRINRRLKEGWVALHNRVLARSVSSSLSVREREAARLAAMGLNNQQIAERQHVSVSTVKQTLRSAMGKTGARSRVELADHI